MKRYLLIFLLLLASVPAHAFIPLQGSNTGGNVCPSPTANGSTIFPNTNCTLVDGFGNTWNFVGTALFANGAQIFSNMAKAVLNQPSGVSQQRVFYPTACDSTAGSFGMLWLMNGNPDRPAIDPFSPAVSPFLHNTTHSTNYNGLYGLQSAAANDQFTMDALPAGLTVFYSASRIGHNNTGNTLNLSAGTIVGCSNDEGNAIIPYDGGSGPIDNFTINGNGGTIGYQNTSDLRCINYALGTNLHLNNLKIVACSFGLQARVVPSGTHTLTNVVFDGHGGRSGCCGSATHNVYVNNYAKGSLGKTSVSGGGSYCTRGTDGGGPGFMWKSRAVSETFQNWTGAEPSQNGFDYCAESAVMDISCGGNRVIGGAGVGQGVLLHVRNLIGNGNEFIRYGRDAKTGNCDSSLTGWSDADCNAADGHNCTLLLQNCILISDAVGPVNVVTIDSTIPAGRVTVKNCKLVGNPAPPSFTITASIDNAGELIVTQTNSVLISGMVLSGPGLNGAYIQYQDSGTPGGVGNYATHLTSGPVPSETMTVTGGSSTISLGPGVIDGGGNIVVASRAAAGYAAYPFLPSPP